VYSEIIGIYFEKSADFAIFASANYQLPLNPPGRERSKGRLVVAVNLPFFLPFINLPI
jgi:hypothetical protein